MTNEWDNMADFWDEHEDVIEYSKLAFVSLNETIDLKNKRILDFGCGSGLLTEKIASKGDAVFAMDSSIKMISVLKNKNIPNITPYCDELSIDFIKKYSQELQTFDIIVASSVCAFLENYEEVLILFKQLYSYLITKNNPFTGINIIKRSMFFELLLLTQVIAVFTFKFT